ncbi:MAG TPA: PEP-CTERM sorting domain-containing protein [Terriglobales bacterium]|nr:PEP-CTERM sorting domain-containing protein [Terriglobales bacterium]
MRRVVLLAVLALALPMLTWADSQIGVTNKGGTITGNSSGLSLSGSAMIAYGSAVGSNLGSVSFTTGAFVSGDPQNGGVLAAGGTFTITGNGTNGVPNGVLFTGTFDAGTKWTLVTLSNGTHNYRLEATITSSNGVGGTTVQLTVNTGKGFFNGSANLESGDTSLTVPEPGTLGLLGTGLVGLAGLLRRKPRN